MPAMPATTMQQPVAPGNPATLPGHTADPSQSGPSLSSLVGQSSNAPASDQSQQIVAAHLKQAATSLQAAVHVKPELARVIDRFMTATEPTVARVLASMQQPAQSSSSSLMQPAGVQAQPTPQSPATTGGQ